MSILHIFTVSWTFLDSFFILFFLEPLSFFLENKDSKIKTIEAVTLLTKACRMKGGPLEFHAIGLYNLAVAHVTLDQPQEARNM